MALEDLTGNKYIDDLVATNPVGATDPRSEGDDHIRGVKNVLLKTFPDISEPFRTNKGALIGNGISTGGGTADAITADFDPDMTLTDGVTVLVRAQGQITVTNPTFAPDGLTAKTIVKGNNEALDLDDIIGTSQELFLRYNSTNDNWCLLNPLNIIPGRGCLVYLDANQSIATSSETAINFDQESFDDLAIHDNATNNERLTVPAGITRIRMTGQAIFAANATGQRTVSIRKNGSLFTGGGLGVDNNPIGTSTSRIPVSTGVITVVAGDYFTLSCWQNSGGNLNVSGEATGYSTWLSMEVFH